MYSAEEVERRWMDVRSMKLTIVEAVTRVIITMTFKEQQEKSRNNYLWELRIVVFLNFGWLAPCLEPGTIIVSHIVTSILSIRRCASSHGSIKAPLYAKED